MPRSKVPRSAQNFNAQDKQARTRLHMLTGDEARPPSQWSKQEAFYRMGCSPSPQGYDANDNGGCPGRTCLYAQDGTNAKSGGEQSCKNTHPSTKKLGPGVLVSPRAALRSIDCTCIMCRAYSWCYVADAAPPSWLVICTFCNAGCAHVLLGVLVYTSDSVDSTTFCIVVYSPVSRAMLQCLALHASAICRLQAQM